MPKANLERNTFIRGLITEASPLTYPENASIDEQNFQLNRDGSRQRRLGMDYEEGFTLLDTSLAFSAFVSTAITGFRWDNVANDAALTFCVIQIANKVYFFDGFSDTLSDNLIGTLTLNTLEGQHPIQYAAINGNLIIVNKKFTHPRLVEYIDEAFVVSDVELTVRDIWGIHEEGVAVTDTPETLTIEHEYNLFNQGWPTTKVRTTDSTYEYAHRYLENRGGTWPSNADIWFVGKNAEDLISLTYYRNATTGNRQAAKGKVLVDAFTRGNCRRNFMNDNSAAMFSTESIEDIPSDLEQGRITTIAAYAGKVFYAGMDGDIIDGDKNSPQYTNTILYSQSGGTTDVLGKCYSINDPTSEDFNEPLPTDGGTITIPEASKIWKLVTNSTSLVVFAENGVWEIAGRDGIFRSDDYYIAQITNVGATNADSIVVVEGTVYYWTKAGIYVLSPDQVTSRLTAKNITETTIQNLYVAIPSVGRTNATGRYDSDSRKVSWLYNDTDSYNGYTQKNKYNKELIFDLVLGSFYIYSIGEVAVDSSYVAGYMPTGGFGVAQDVQSVTHNGEQVVVNSVPVVVTSNVRSIGRSSTKYITVKPNSTGTVEFTFSSYNNTEFLDWEADDTVGVDAASYLITGYELFQDSARKKYIPYLTMHFRRTEDDFVEIAGEFYPLTPSGCLVRARWDWADSSGAGKWGSQFQAYRLSRMHAIGAIDEFDYGYAVVTTKNRLRGSGKAFSMRIDSEAGKDCHLYGWAISVSGGSNV